MMRKTKRRFKLSVASVVLLLSAAVGASAQEPLGLELPDLLRLPGTVLTGEDFRVTARLEPETQVPGHAVVAVVRFFCPEQWYIYADSISVNLLFPKEEAPAAKEGSLYLPEPKSKYDQLLDQEVEYFDGQFEAKLVLYVLDDAAQGEQTFNVRISYQGCEPNLCFPPTKRDLELRLSVLEPGSKPVPVVMPTEELPASREREIAGEAQRYEKELAEHSLIAAAVIAFVAGLGLALTPCVYPMIPVTMTVIGATTTDRKLSALFRSLVYVFGISMTYAALGVVAARAGEAFGTLLQNPFVYLTLAVVFVVMAAAMFGLLTIQVPASWMARLQGKVRGRWGLLGILGLGLLSGIAVTPCVAPVVSGAMAYVFRSRNMMAGFVILFAIAWGMGTPLVVLGTFSGLLKALPKSGRWQQGVKYAFGVGLLGAALYFVVLSGVLPRSWFERRAPGESIAWVTSEEQALRQAQQQGKPVMLYFWQTRCPACDKLKAGSFSDARVVAESRRFVAAMIDGTHWNSEQRRDMRRKYGVWGFPTITFISSEGDILEELTIVGYKDARALLETMRQVP